MPKYSGYSDRDRVESAMAFTARDLPTTLYDFLKQTAQKFPNRPAVSFQLLSGPGDHATTLNWGELLNQVTQTANFFRDCGVGPSDVVAYLLPNSIETPVVLLGGAVAGIVNPINPLLESKQIAGILRETKAKVLVTLKAFPKSDIAQKAAEAVALSPDVVHVVEVDLNTHLRGIKHYIVPFIRPKVTAGHQAKIHDFTAAISKHPGDRLGFENPAKDRIAAYFHTGGTTGMPKVAQHKYSGMIYNGWLGGELLFDETDVLMCPLPMFHVFAAYPALMSCIASGAHLVMPTPAGYRGDGVFDNLWKLIERWRCTFLITVPTAISALMQRPVDADVSSLKMAMSGSAPLPVELYNRFKQATGVEIAEGYGLTEATCLVSCNPVDGPKKVGSVGIPMPYTSIRIINHASDGTVHVCGADEVGEVCVSNPGVLPGSTYTETDKNRDLFADGTYLRTGDLGRLDPDGYLWITGRAKDLIIRGGHNIDPAAIEDEMLNHPQVAFAGAIGQPDKMAGELPCVYVELVAGATISTEELTEYVKQHVHERAAMPKYIEILPELPKTAVGKIFKPDLRKLAIRRVYNDALEGTGAAVIEVVESKKRGLVARLSRTKDVDEAKVGEILGDFVRPWEWAD